MKQKIKLTKENDGTIHVDDVDVSKGVYAKSDTNLQFVIMDSVGTIAPVYVNGMPTGHYGCLKSYIEQTNDRWNIYTLSGLRIVTEKEFSVEDLKDGDIIGMLDNCGVKWFTHTGPNGYIFLNYSGENLYETNAHTLQGAIGSTSFNVDLYLFTTRKELYAWLAE